MINFRYLLYLIATVILFVIAQSAGAAGLPNVPNAHQGKFLPNTTEIQHAFMSGKPDVWLRMRYEDVNDEDLPPTSPLNAADDADLLSLRAVLGYTTARYYGFYFRGSIEAARRLNGDNALNLDEDVRLMPPTLLGQNRVNEGHAIIPDNDFEEIEELYIGWRSPTGGCPMAPGPCSGNTSFKLGRQLIAYDNHRWIGDVIWRNNNQTFDAFRFDNTSIKNLSISYSYIDKVNRLFGKDSAFNEFEMEDTHFINISYKLPIGKLTAYRYMLDFKDNSRTPFVEGTGWGPRPDGTLPIFHGMNINPVTGQPIGAPGLGSLWTPFDSDTWGVRFVGKHKMSEDLTLLSELEWANQDPEDDAHNRLDDNDYYNAEFGGAFTALGKPMVLKLGYEVLEGNGVNAIQTPLSTVHAFNGWADKFVAAPGGSNTPSRGLKDTSVTFVVKGLVGPSKLVFQYHNYEADKKTVNNVRMKDYGDEWSLLFAKPFTKKWLGLMKYTSYNADEFGNDTQKFWMMAQYRFK